MRYSSVVNQPVPQTQPLNTSQVQNSAGGYGYAVTHWAALDRFILLGTCGGTYYTGERDLTKQNVDSVLQCILEDGPRVVRRIVEIDRAGRAPKRQAAQFALALCIRHGDADTRAEAYNSVALVCRTASHLFDLAAELDGLGKGWSRGLRTAVGSWYTGKSENEVAYQAIKYGTRAGWSHRDVLRLAHPKSDSAVLRWLVKGGEPSHPQIQAAEALKTADAQLACRLIADHRLPRECVPTNLLNDPLVWDALSMDMPIAALVRNLAKMTEVGLLSDGSEASRRVVDQLGDVERLRRGRVHPLNLLVGMKTYASGAGVRGSLKWAPVSRITSALSEAIALSFGALPESDRREVIAIDVSGSMRVRLGQFGGLWLHEAAACMACAAVAANPGAGVVTFHTTWQPFDVHGRRWDDVANQLVHMGGGGTDFCQAIHAAESVLGEKPVMVQVYTDNETWAGVQHPEQAWQGFKAKSPNAKCVVASMTANGTVAMPTSPDVLQVVGFDSAIPEIVDAWSA